MAHEVFLCHSARDKAIADAACAALEAQRISCWIAPRDVLAGEEWGKSIIEALSSSNIVVLIFSGYANESPQVRREIERAVSKAKIIVPFRIENVLPSDAMEYALGNTHWLDAMSPPMEQSLSNLCQTICRLLQRQHPLQPLWKPGDAVAAAEVKVEKASSKEEPPVKRNIERAIVSPELADETATSSTGDAPRNQMASGERIASQPVVAARASVALPPAPPIQTPPAPIAAAPAPPMPTSSAPVAPVWAPPVPVPVPPAPAATVWAPPMPVQARVAEVSAGAPAGSKTWVWVAGIFVIALLAIVAFALPRLRKTNTPVTPPATSAADTPAVGASAAAPAPIPAPEPQPAPETAPLPVPEAEVDQPAPTVDTPVAVLPKPTAAAPVKSAKSVPPGVVPTPPKVVPNEGSSGNDLSLAKSVCAAGTPRGCMRAGQMFEHGEGTAKDEGQARTFYQKACDLGEARGCTNLALMYETSQKPENAVLFYRKGCDKGNPIGCTQLGVMYDKGQGVSQNYAQAATLYRRGCDGGNLRACSNLGSLYLGGRGVARDESQAMNLYRQACSGGYEIACGHMKTQSP